MIRSVLSAVKNIRTVGSLYPPSICSLAPQPTVVKNILESALRNYSSKAQSFSILGRVCASSSSNKLSNVQLLQPKPLQIDTIRDVTKFSLSGKRKSVKLVLMKFYRLHWGCWIRTKCGRHKKLYKKSAHRRRRLQYHVFCNGRQSYLLDRMVTRYWRKPRFYVDDPYEPYHTRDEYPHARMKPYQPFA